MIEWEKRNLRDFLFHFHVFALELILLFFFLWSCDSNANITIQLIFFVRPLFFIRFFFLHSRAIVLFSIWTNFFFFSSFLSMTPRRIQNITHIMCRLHSKQGPEGFVDKPFLWTEGRVCLRAALDKSAYIHGEHISVSIDVKNESRKIIRKIRVRHLRKWEGESE